MVGGGVTLGKIGPYQNINRGGGGTLGKIGPYQNIKQGEEWREEGLLWVRLAPTRI